MTEATTVKNADQNSGPADPAPGVDAKPVATKDSPRAKGSSKSAGSNAKPKAKTSGTTKSAPSNKTAEAKAPAASIEPRQTKAATVEAMLSSKEGATLEAMYKATGWQSHTCRAFLTGLRKKGREVVRYKDGQGGSIYRMTPLEAQEASA